MPESLKEKKSVGPECGGFGVFGERGGEKAGQEG